MRYSDGIAFRQALEQRLKTRAGGQEARLVRDRKRVAFDRLLARLAATAPDRFRSEPTAQTDTLSTPGLLSFAGIEPVTVRAIPLELQVAEKLHAYTRVYEHDRSSTRVKDLVDLALIAELFTLDAAALRAAINVTFTGRGTHHPPPLLPPPPQEWRIPYRQLAQDVGVAESLDAGYAIAAVLLDPLLDDKTTHGHWSPAETRWITESRRPPST